MEIIYKTNIRRLKSGKVKQTGQGPWELRKNATWLPWTSSSLLNPNLGAEEASHQEMQWEPEKKCVWVGGEAPSKACSLPKAPAKRQPNKTEDFWKTPLCSKHRRKHCSTLPLTPAKVSGEPRLYLVRLKWGSQHRRGGHIREDRFHPHQALYGDHTEPGVPPSPCSGLLTLSSVVVLETGLPPSPPPTEP